MSINFQLKHRCPHCGELCDFIVGQLFETIQFIDASRNPPVWMPRKLPFNHGVQGHPQKETNFVEGVSLSRCGNCANPVMFVVDLPRYIFSEFSSPNSLGAGGSARLVSQFRIKQTYPEAKKVDSHPSWPNPIQQPFIELQQFVIENRQPVFIVMGCRMVLESVLKDLKGEGDDNFKRIDDLAKRGIITGSLKDWAHEIRKRGNDAAHDLNAGTPEEAAELVNFIKLLLHVCYELPEAIRDKRSARPPSP